MKKIREFVVDLKCRYNSTDPFFICKNLDISIISMDLPTRVKGFYVKFFESKIIYINSLLEDHEKRCICAHELGHAIFHEEINSIFMNKESETDIKKYRTRADYFAACLLIDDNIFKEFYDNKYQSLEEIALFSGVDRKLVEIRMKAI